MKGSSKGSKREQFPKDEPGAEERFMRGIRKALNTPPTKRADQPPKRDSGRPAKNKDRR